MGRVVQSSGEARNRVGSERHFRGFELVVAVEEHLLIRGVWRVNVTEI
jgi:hypothetical protein